MADKDFLDKSGTSYLWSKTKQKIDNAKASVDNYTINGKKISSSPKLTASDVGAAPVVAGKIPSQYMPSYVDDTMEIKDGLAVTISNLDWDNEDVYLNINTGKLTQVTDNVDIIGIKYDGNKNLFYLETLEATDEGAEYPAYYFEWSELIEYGTTYPASATFGSTYNPNINIAGGKLTSGVKPTEGMIYIIGGTPYLAGSTLSSYTYESGKIYVNTLTNKTYRWSGSQLVEVGGGVALGETSETAFAGDKGKEVYDAVFTKNMPVVVPEIVINSYTATDQSGNVTPNTTRNGNTVTIERGIKLSYNVAFRWNSANGYKDPTAIVAGTTWYDASKEKGGLPLKGVLSASKTGTTESALTLTAKVSAPKIGLMVDSNNNVTKAEGNDVAENSFKVSLTYRRYFGVIANGSTINEELIKGLSSELNTSRGKTIAINVNNSQQYVYAYESALNEASISKGVEDEKSFWTTGTLNITNQYGKTISYRYYVCGAGAYKGANIKFG